MDMYFSLIIMFLILILLIVTGIQNSMPIDLKFFSWNFQISPMALIFYSSLLGGAVVAVISLPKLVSKSLKVRRLNKEIYNLKLKSADLERGQEES